MPCARILDLGERTVPPLPQRLLAPGCARPPCRRFPRSSECYVASAPGPHRPVLAAGCVRRGRCFGPCALRKCGAIRLFAMPDDSHAKKDALASPLAWRISRPPAGRTQYPLLLLWRVACMAGAKCQRCKDCHLRCVSPPGRPVARILEPLPLRVCCVPTFMKNQQLAWPGGDCLVHRRRKIFRPRKAIGASDSEVNWAKKPVRKRYERFQNGILL
jgi:hypothetical protein